MMERPDVPSGSRLPAPGNRQVRRPADHNSCGLSGGVGTAPVLREWQGGACNSAGVVRTLVGGEVGQGGDDFEPPAADLSYY